MSRRRTLSGMLLATMIGCSSSGVTSDELLGTWVITSRSRARLSPAYERALGKITFKQDGTFVADEPPRDLLYSEPEQAVPPVTGRGTWKLNDKTQLDLVFDTITIGQERRTPYGTHLMVTGSRSGRNLSYFQGDPDQAKRIAFEKQ